MTIPDAGIVAHTVRDRSERLAFLDGIRGWGAIVVLGFHLFVNQGLRATPEASQLIHLFFLNGPFAVCVFFVTSGFSLSIGILTRKSTDVLIRLAAGRYFRLAVPIFAICFVTDMLMRWNLVPSVDQRPFPFNLILLFEPSLLHVARFSLFDVFVNYSQRISYNPPLWSMSFELIGSYMVFGLLTIQARRLRWIVCGILLVFGLATVSLYALFIAGICIAEAYALNFHRRPFAQAICAAFLVLAAI